MKKLDNKQLTRIGAIFIAAVAAGWIIWLFATGKAGEFAGAIASANPRWIVMGLVSYACYFLLDALCFRISGMLTGTRLGAADLVSIVASGIAFGYLTPGNSGAGPAQIVRLAHAGLSVGDASAVELTRFFIYKVAISVFGAFLVFTKLPYFYDRFGSIVLLAVLGLLGHFGIMVALFGVIFFPNLVRKIGRFGIRLFSQRFHFIKNPEKALTALEDQIDQYAASVGSATDHMSSIASAAVISIVQLACLFAIPYFVIRALGVPQGVAGMDGMDPFTAMSAAIYVQLMLALVPLPGGTGGAEGAFYLFFGPALGANIGTGVVLWRLTVYYLPILASFGLLALRSSMSPQERFEIYGEAQVGTAQIASDMRVAREKATEQQAHVQIHITEAQIRRRNRRR